MQNGSKTNCQVGPLHLTLEMASQMAGLGVPWAAPWTFLGAKNGPKTNCQVGPLHLTVEMASQMAGLGVPWTLLGTLGPDS